MMKNNLTENNAVDQQFRKALANAEKETSASWETLQMQLVQLQKRKRNRKIIWWTSAAAAACLLCVGMFWFMWYNPYTQGITAVRIAPEPIPTHIDTPKTATMSPVYSTTPSPAQQLNDTLTARLGNSHIIAHNDGRHVKPKRQKNASSSPLNDATVLTNIKYSHTDTTTLLAINQPENALQQNTIPGSATTDVKKVDLPSLQQNNLNLDSVAEYATVHIIKAPTNIKTSKTQLLKKLQKSIYQAQILLSDSSIAELRWEVNKRIVAWVNNNR